MPFYTFKCPECKKEKEEIREMGDTKEPTCSECSTILPRRYVYMKRIFTKIGKPQFKGKGFYETDYKKKSK